MLVLAGCEDAQERAAREATQRHVAALPAAREYDVADTHCTDSARTGVIFGRVEETSIFLCVVRRVDGDCDSFRVEAARPEPRIRLEERRADCVLPG